VPALASSRCTISRRVSRLFWAAAWIIGNALTLPIPVLPPPRIFALMVSLTLNRSQEQGSLVSFFLD
jgi:hypothetical protein